MKQEGFRAVLVSAGIEGALIALEERVAALEKGEKKSDETKSEYYPPAVAEEVK